MYAKQNIRFLIINKTLIPTMNLKNYVYHFYYLKTKTYLTFVKYSKFSHKTQRKEAFFQQKNMKIRLALQSLK